MKRILYRLSRLIQTVFEIRQSRINRDSKIKILKTFLRAIVFERANSEKKMVSLAGFDFKYFSRQSFVFLFNEIFIRHDYLFQCDKKNPLIIDGGSNIGMSVLYFKLIYPNAEIIAFEPEEKTFELLNENITRNNLEQIELHQKALGNYKGNINFYYDPDRPGTPTMSLIKQRLPKSKTTVESVLLSSYVDREIDFLKMDIEGREFDVLQELNNAGKLILIKQMVIEYHHHIDIEIDRLSEILKLLEDAGFGYQLSTQSQPLHQAQTFQDILIYAYKK